MKDVTVMFVDDEQNVLNSLDYNLIREPYKKLFANSGKDALDLMSREEIHVVVADMKMPVMDGLTLLQEIKTGWPATVRMVLSGFTEIAQIIEAINTGEIFRYVTKPIEEPQTFRNIIHDAVNYYLLRQDKEELISNLQQKNEELANALSRVRKLEGMIPICCYCKKIRDDKDYWEEVEEYVQNRSNAVFSHGICPACMKKYIEPMLSQRGLKLDEEQTT